MNNAATDSKLRSSDDSLSLGGSPSIPSLELQAAPLHLDKDSYQLGDLLGYHDRAFVTQVYYALLKRAPTSDELSRAISALRGGRHTKIEIIESLLSKRPGGSQVQVHGLSRWRRLREWPFIGYLVRLAAAFARLPKMSDDQQRFENYSLGQQQNIADYVNEVVMPAVTRDADAMLSLSNLSTTVADALESLLMLSERLIELTGRFEDFQSRYEAELEQRRSEIEEMQTVQAMTAAAQEKSAAAQQEFLVQEQRVIIETQKAVLADFRRQLDEVSSEQRRLAAELETRMRELHQRADNAPTGEDKRQRAAKSRQG